MVSEILKFELQGGFGVLWRYFHMKFDITSKSFSHNSQNGSFSVLFSPICFSFQHSYGTSRTADTADELSKLVRDSLALWQL